MGQAENNIGSTIKTSNFKNSDKPRIKKYFYLIVLVIIVFGSSIGYYLYYQNSKNQSEAVCSTGTNTSLLDQASRDIQNNKSVQTEELKITRLNNFQKDPNCLYVVTYYFVSIGNGSQATNYMNQLQRLYSPKVGLSPHLKGVPSVAILQKDIQFIIKQNQQIESQIKTESRNVTDPIQPNPPK